jgi:integration host factor beta subunit
MNKSDLVREVTRVSGLTHETSETVVTAIFERIIEALVKGDHVEIRGLGTFDIRQRRARTARNPKTGAAVSVPAHKVPFFKMGRELRSILNPAPAGPAPVPEPAHP